GRFDRSISCRSINWYCGGNYGRAFMDLLDKIIALSMQKRLRGRLREDCREGDCFWLRLFHLFQIEHLKTITFLSRNNMKHEVWCLLSCSIAACNQKRDALCNHGILHCSGKLSTQLEKLDEPFLG